MKAQLAASAARRDRGRGWSVTQEILRRIYDAFRKEREDRRDRPARSLSYLLAETISAARHNISPDWRSDPFAYRTVRLAFDRVLDKLAPPGEIRPPARRSKAAHGMEPLALPGSGSFFLWDEEGEITPEKMAHMISDLVLAALARPPLTEVDPSWGPMNREQEDFEYGMSDARRGLQIGKGE
jgi:hypothetical protein